MMTVCWLLASWRAAPGAELAMGSGALPACTPVVNRLYIM